MASVLQSLNFKYENNTVSGSEVFIVYGVATASAAAQAVSRTPGSGGLTVANPFGGPAAIVQSVNVQAVTDAVQTWTVTVEWAAEQGDASYAQVTSDIGGTFIDVWRSQSAPSNGDPTGSDIAGTKVDSAGEPVSVFCWQTSLQVVRRYSGNSVPWSTIWGNLGKRNSVVMEGAAIGQLLFKGVKASSIGKCRYEVTYDFMGDQFFHCRQVPTRESDGRVKLVDNQAYEVKWYQPFTAKAALHTMLGTYDVCDD
jgi:hypothetical protein